MKVFNLINALQKQYNYYGNVNVIVSELDDVQLICEPDDTKEIKGVDSIPYGEGAIVLKI